MVAFQVSGSIMYRGVNGNVSHIIICSGCFYGRSEASEHACLMYLFGTIPLSEDQRIQFLNECNRRELTDTENIEALFLSI